MADWRMLPPNYFGAILADPPWTFKSFSGKTGTPHRSANDHYSTTSTKDLMQIPVADVAAPDCALFMWVVDSHLTDALDLARAWGFDFKTRAFTWRKLTGGASPKSGWVTGPASKPKCACCLPAAGRAAWAKESAKLSMRPGGSIAASLMNNMNELKRWLGVRIWSYLLARADRNG